MTDSFLSAWRTSATTTLGLFWMALWAFGLGYLVSSMIQVFVTRERMRRSMGGAGVASVALAAVFGFVSSSCSFAALATTRSLFAKGAGLVPALAFLLASTNLVVELGIVIALFLSWHFVVAEYLGGVLLILLVWLLVVATRPTSLVARARRRLREEGEGDDGDEPPDWRRLIVSRDGWRRVAERYVMEWRMVWKDVVIGFTVAGAIAAFVPRAFFEALFVGAGAEDPAPWQVLLQALAAPAAAFFTFIGSMGNIPLAAVLYGNGVTFAGIVAFLFSDLVVFPVLRIQARYYGWPMALYVAGLFLVALVAAALALHYGFALFDALPSPGTASHVTERAYFAVDHTLVLDLLFVVLSAVFVTWKWRSSGFAKGGGEPTLLMITVVALAWLVGGLAIPPLAGS